VADAFNTKKVRLKLQHTSFASFYDNLFQYQKGAIKTPAWLSGCGGHRTFQYQKGAIKTST